MHKLQAQQQQVHNSLLITDELSFHEEIMIVNVPEKYFVLYDMRYNGPRNERLSVQSLDNPLTEVAWFKSAGLDIL